MIRNHIALFQSNHAAASSRASRAARPAFQRAAARLLLTLALAVTLNLPAPLVARAQETRTVTQDVRFPRGRTTVILRGAARQYTFYIYKLRARAGQTMSVRITGSAQFSISPVTPPEADTEPLEGAEGVRDWSGTLPDNGVYQVVVFNNREGTLSVPYTLEITIR